MDRGDRETEPAAPIAQPCPGRTCCGPVGARLQLRQGCAPCWGRRECLCAGVCSSRLEAMQEKLAAWRCQCDVNRMSKLEMEY